jgi:hypothetical protein
MNLSAAGVAILFTSSNLGEQIVSRAVLRMSTAWLTIREPGAPLLSFHGLRCGFVEARLEVRASVFPRHVDGGSHIGL